MPWNRLITFIAAEDHTLYHGEPCDASLDVGLAYSQRKSIQARVLAPGASPLDASAEPSNVVKTVATLLPPLSAEQIPSIRALGANFVQPKQDPTEAKQKRPVIPILFYKPLTALSGPEREIVIPRAAQKNGDETDWEVELVSGRGCEVVAASSREGPLY